MTLDDLSYAQEVALSAARKAARLLQEGFRKRDLIIEKKSAIDPVTQYDRGSEKILTEALQKAFPDHLICGEESGTWKTSIDDRDAQSDTPIWYIDPLDGTVNYTHRIPWYAISMGLEIGDEGVLGVIVAPENKWELTAIKGQGAYLNGEKVSVTQTKDMIEALAATGFPYQRSDFDNVACMRQVLENAQGIRRMGTASLDCLALACGWIDAYWEYGLKPWDMSAGAVIIKEAGGKVTNLTNERYTSTQPSIAASNGLLHNELIRLLANAHQSETS